MNQLSNSSDVECTGSKGVIFIRVCDLRYSSSNGFSILSTQFSNPQNQFGPKVVSVFLFVATGELYTWGKGGPRLGYESSSRKEILPRFVEGLEEHRVGHVACGRNHTLGKLMSILRGRRVGEWVLKNNYHGCLFPSSPAGGAQGIMERTGNRPCTFPYPASILLPAVRLLNSYQLLLVLPCSRPVCESLFALRKNTCSKLRCHMLKRF